MVWLLWPALSQLPHMQPATNPTCFQCLTYNRLPHPPSLHLCSASPQLSPRTCPSPYDQRPVLPLSFLWVLTIFSEIFPDHADWLQYVFSILPLRLSLSQRLHGIARICLFLPVHWMTLEDSFFKSPNTVAGIKENLKMYRGWMNEIHKLFKSCFLGTSHALGQWVKQFCRSEIH